MRKPKRQPGGLMRNLSRLSSASYIILMTGLPVISAYLIGMALFLRYFPSEHAYVAIILTPSLLEHILMSLTLLIGGALLFDWMYKRDGKR